MGKNGTFYFLLEAEECIRVLLLYVWLFFLSPIRLMLYAMNQGRVKALFARQETFLRIDVHDLKLIILSGFCCETSVLRGKLTLDVLLDFQRGIFLSRPDHSILKCHLIGYQGRPRST